MSAPWVFAEAYKYRRLRECFSVSKYWKDYDVFFRQKVGRAPQACFLRSSTPLQVRYLLTFARGCIRTLHAVRGSQSAACRDRQSKLRRERAFHVLRDHAKSVSTLADHAMSWLTDILP